MSQNNRLLVLFAVIFVVIAVFFVLSNPPSSSRSNLVSTPIPTGVALTAGPGQQTLDLGGSNVLASSSRSDDGVTDTLSLTNGGTQEIEVAIFTVTPKEDAASASELEVSGKSFVLENDPVTVQTGTLSGRGSAEFSVKKNRVSQFGSLQLVVDYNAWQGADRDALTTFIKSLNKKVPALKYDAAQRLSYDLNYKLNDKTVASLSQRVLNAQALLDRDLPALVVSSGATSATQTLYATEPSGSVLASVDPMSGLAYFKAKVSPLLFSTLQSAKTAPGGLPSAEFRPLDRAPVAGSKVYYDLCGGELCVLIDLHGTTDYSAALGNEKRWSG